MRGNQKQGTRGFGGRLGNGRRDKNRDLWPQLNRNNSRMGQRANRAQTVRGC